MKFYKSLFIVMAFFAITSCSEDDSSQPVEELSSSKDLQSLILEYDGTEFRTNITNSNVVNSLPLPFLAEQVKIKSFQVSTNATINVSIGQVLEIGKSPFEIKVEASDGSTKVYYLILNKDEGLQVEPNPNIEDESSHSLQDSDVYVDGAQLTQDFNRFFSSAYADFNNDGETDVLLASGIFQSKEFSPILLFLGDGSGFNNSYCECGGECSGYNCDSFIPVTNALPEGYEGLQHPRKILTGDYNGDSLIDAFIIGHGYDAAPFPGESPVLLLNTNNGFNYSKLHGVKGFFHGGSSADFDNDGDVDIFLIGGPSSVEAIFLINDGEGNFSSSSEFIDEEFHHDTKYYTSEFIDINSDGFIDLLIAGHEHEGAITYILWGNSSGKYFKDLSATISQVSGYNIIVDIDATDMDSDGDKDLILNRVDSNNFYENYFLQIIENKGNGNFSDVTSASISNNSGANWYISLHLQDLDNDGIEDIYLENDHYANLKWFGDGTGNFNR